MKKYVKLIVVILLVGILIIVGWYLYALNSSLDLSSDEAEITLVDLNNTKIGRTFKLNSFAGNATVSNTLKFIEIKDDKEVCLSAIETFDIFKIVESKTLKNDSIYTIVLTTAEGVIDTVDVNVGVSAGFVSITHNNINGEPINH